MKPLMQVIDEFAQQDDECLEEVGSDGGDYSYGTPYAFSKNPPSIADKRKMKDRISKNGSYTSALESKIFSKIHSTINEVSYTDFVGDDSMTSSQKINNIVSEVNKKLFELEKAITRGMKFKKEVNANQTVFWKSTQGKFTKIAERLNRLNNYIREYSA